MACDLNERLGEMPTYKFVKNLHFESNVKLENMLKEFKESQGQSIFEKAAIGGNGKSGVESAALPLELSQSKNEVKLDTFNDIKINKAVEKYFEEMVQMINDMDTKYNNTHDELDKVWKYIENIAKASKVAPEAGDEENNQLMNQLSFIDQ